MRRPTPHRLWDFVTTRLPLRTYVRAPNDGRVRPPIPAAVLLWALLIGHVLREWSFHGVEALVRSSARRALRVGRRFGDDALAYFTERLAPAATRQALAATVRHAKRNKAFGRSGWIGLALDGTGVGRCAKAGGVLCQPVRDSDGAIHGDRHHLVVVSVVGVDLTLPFDVEPYGPGDSEYGAGQRLLERAVAAVGARFADYVVVDGEFATAPFLHRAGELGIGVVARLKGNLPQLFAAAQARYADQPAPYTLEDQGDRVELWDADDFDPWETLRWPTVRVLRYRQYKPAGAIVEAYWRTDLPCARVGPRALYRFAKSRWEIENEGFNEAKTRHGLEHLTHHHANSLVIGWLLTMFALTIERLYRLRYLRRGTHGSPTAIEFERALRLSLCPPPRLNSS